MRNILVFLLAVFAPFAFAQRSPSCQSAPPDAQVVVPPELRKWISIECGEGGHVVTPAPGYAWRANTDGQPLKLPAVGPGGMAVDTGKGVPKVKSPNGAYEFEGGALKSPHDAYFEKSRIFPITEEFLVWANEVAFKQKGYAGPYRKGYLYDLLSNQGFQYRVFVLLADNSEPQMINVIIRVDDKERRLTALVTRR